MLKPKSGYFNYVLLALLILALVSFMLNGRLLSVFSFLFMLLAGGRLLLLLKRKAFWKIRNRLIISSLFFTVTPIALTALFFMTVINLLVIQNNAVIFENIMSERAMEMERLAGRYQNMLANPETLRTFLIRGPRQRPQLLAYWQRQAENWQSAFVHPIDFPVDNLALPLLQNQSQSGYLLAGGRLYFGMFKESENGLMLLADVIDQEYFDRLPRIGDFSVIFSPPSKQGATWISPALEIGSEKSPDSNVATSGPYPFEYWDLDNPVNGRPQVRYHFFTLQSDYARIFQRVRTSNREKLLRDEITGLHKALEEGRLDAAETRIRLAEAERELAFYSSGNRGLDVFSKFSFVLYVLLGIFGFFIVVSLVIGFGMVRTITKSVDQISKGTERIRRGDFSFRIKLRSRDQMQSLADSFNEMAAGINRLLIEEKERQRMEEELRIARNIQLKLLPEESFSCPEFDIAAANIPAAEIAGDYFDYFYQPGNQLTVLVADVSGKGASAAFYMAELKGLMNYLQKSFADPIDLVDECHQGLSASLDKVTFITMNIARFSLSEKKIFYTRSGHTPAIYYQAEKRECLTLTPRGPAIGITGFNREQLQRVSLPFNSGDILFFFSDGLSEIMNPDGEQLGVERLSVLLCDNHQLDPQDIRQLILDYTVSFSHRGNNPDDLTFLIVKVK